jgi:hypothetical protein
VVGAGLEAPFLVRFLATRIKAKMMIDLELIEEDKADGGRA